MDKIELNGEIYIKESTMNNIDDKELLALLEKSSISSYEIAEILKDKLRKEIENNLWVVNDIENDNSDFNDIMLYHALYNYC